MNAEEARKASKQVADKLHKLAEEKKEKARLASIEKAKIERESFVKNLKDSFEFYIKDAIKKGSQSCLVNLHSYKDPVTLKEFKKIFYYFDEAEKMKKEYQKKGYDISYKIYSETNYVWYSYESGDGRYETCYNVALEIKW